MTIQSGNIYIAIMNDIYQQLHLRAQLNPCAIRVCVYLWNMLSYSAALCRGECPNNSPFLTNNGVEAPKGLRPIGFKEWRVLRAFTPVKPSPIYPI